MAAKPLVKRKGRPVHKGSSERGRGALLGLAVGDALGATNEGRKLHAPMFPELCAGAQVDMRGGGPHALKPGQVTDDTQMAILLSASLLDKHKLDLSDLSKRYLKWMALAVGMDRQVAQALEKLEARQQWPDLAGRELWEQNAKQPATHASLARTAPLGVYFWKDGPERLDATFAESAFTHFDPRCQLACAAFNGAIAHAVRSSAAVTAEQLAKAAEKELTQAAALLGRRIPLYVREVQSAVEQLRADLAAARDSNPMLYGPELNLLTQHGSLRVAFRLAFWELHHAPSFEAALIDVVNRGGDSASFGAITGALLGACHGESSLPERWKTPVLEALSDKPLNPLWTLYHPRLLLPLADFEQ